LDCLYCSTELETPLEPENHNTILFSNFVNPEVFGVCDKIILLWLVDNQSWSDSFPIPFQLSGSYVDDCEIMSDKIHSVKPTTGITNCGFIINQQTR
jgi:hypothetical protein